jgi:hypothetical protein
VNFILPASLRGRGTLSIVLIQAGVRANPVEISVQ